MFSFRLLIGYLVVGAGFGFTLEASAHIRLSEPLARYEITGADTGIKGCPCGLATGGGNSNRTCNVELDGSDPARNEERASTFPAGSTIKLKFEEYVGHEGRYRVAFDPEGADFEDFNANVIHDETDPAGSQGNINDGSKWEIEVTLPDTPCNNCTLQLLQVMAGGTENPVDGSNLATLSTYYTCIDLTLTAPEGNSTDDESVGDSSEASVSSAEETSESTGEEASSSEEVGSSSVETTGASISTAVDERSSDEEATSTNPTVPSSDGVAPPNPSTNATTAPTSTAGATTTASATSSVNSATTETPIPDEDAGDDTEEGACSIAATRGASPVLLAVFGTVLGALVCRRRLS